MKNIHLFSTAFVATETSEPTPDNTIIHQCLEVSSEVETLQEVAGTGTVATYDSELISKYLLDLETGTQYSLPLKPQSFLPPPDMSVLIWTTLIGWRITALL